MRAQMSGCHHSMKDIKQERSARPIRPMLIVTNKLPRMVKSVLVFQA